MSYAQRKVMRALMNHGIVVIREGGNHTIVRGPTGRQSSIARHNQLNRITVRTICRQLDLDWKIIEKELA